MANSTGELAKLKIIPFSDAEFSEQAGDEFLAQVNPEKVSFKYQVELEEQQGSGTSGAQPRFEKIKPQEMTFEFLFDATGAIPLPDGTSAIDDKGITTRLDEFKNVVLKFSGDEHKPNNLKLIWGTILFKCMLTEVNIEYSLFKSDGTPIRARASAKFVGYIEDELRLAEERRQSPDVTHARQVKSGETLQQLVHEVYGDPSPYLEVARANRLTNFRNLTTGQILQFPPIDPTSDANL